MKRHVALLAVVLAAAACTNERSVTSIDGAAPGRLLANMGTGGGGHNPGMTAVFTTFDATQGGCTQGNNPNGINCNLFASKPDVYLGGGPAVQNLAHAAIQWPDGDYFFAVVTPGEQNGGWADGANGNLSDTFVGGTAGDQGIGDDVSNRTFTIAGGTLVYGGTHTMGQTPNGNLAIQLYPFDDTDNPGGEYVMMICEVGATSPSQCMYDNFKVKRSASDDPPPFPIFAGAKYYDANANGQRDAGEVGIAGWPIIVSNGTPHTVLTGSDGSFSEQLVAGMYTFVERQAAAPWMQTGNRVDQTVSTGGSSATLEAFLYTATGVDGGRTDGIDFGNLCVGAGGGLTLGFWSNKNGQNTMTSGGMASELALLAGLNLRTAAGVNFDPTSYAQFRTWILNATATNMAYMLSAQLATMELNVRNGGVNGAALLYAPGATSANVNGFTTVNDLMAEANAALGANGYVLDGNAVRAYQEALKNALDNGNNNRNFVQASPATCPAPVF